MKLWTMMALLLITLPATTSARADAVRISGMWIENATITGVTDGRLVYTTSAGGQLEMPLARVEGVRLSAYPQYQQAVEANEAGDPARAAQLLTDMRSRVRQTWVDQLAARELIAALAGSGRALPAAQLYVQLVQDAVDPWFTPAPPIDAVARASAADRARIRRVMTAALQRSDDAARPILQRLLDAAADEAPSPEPNDAAPDAPAGDGGAATDPPRSAILLPVRTPDGPVVQLLRHGDFEQALELVERALAVEGELARKLYLKGMAQLGIADQTGNEDRFKDAGLSFMRVVAYFPRSTWAGYARAELAYVHHRIGRDDQARKLVDHARLAIGEQDDQAYHQRIMEIASRL